MKSLFGAVLCVFLFNFADSLNVSVYYESLCPDSVKFITKQLYPHRLELQDFINLELIPYGKATHEIINGSWSFLCQHGPPECKGNKYQACVLDQNKGQENDISIIFCIMRTRNQTEAHIESCANRFQYNFKKIQTCAEGAEGDELLANYGNRTYELMSGGLSFVPTIVFDGVYNQIDQGRALKDFAAVVCSKINGTKPSVCTNRKLPKMSFFDYYF